METLRGRLEQESWGTGGVTVVEEDGGPPSAPDIEVHLQGEDWSSLRRTADRLRAYLTRTGDGEVVFRLQDRARLGGQWAQTHPQHDDHDAAGRGHHWPTFSMPNRANR